MKSLQRRAERHGEEAERRIARKLLAQVRATLPAVQVNAEGNRLVITGRSLWRRFVNHAQLRFIRDTLR